MSIEAVFGGPREELAALKRERSQRGLSSANKDRLNRQIRALEDRLGEPHSEIRREPSRYAAAVAQSRAQPSPPPLPPRPSNPAYQPFRGQPHLARSDNPSPAPRPPSRHAAPSAPPAARASPTEVLTIDDDSEDEKDAAEIRRLRRLDAQEAADRELAMRMEQEDEDRALAEQMARTGMKKKCTY